MNNSLKIEVLEINIKYRYFLIIIITAFTSFIGLAIIFSLVENEILKVIFGLLLIPLVFLITNKVARQIMYKINYKNVGNPVIAKSGILQIGDKSINLNNAEKIIFRYAGDEFWKSKNQILETIKRRQRYNKWVLIDKNLIFDNLQIDQEFFYFKILNESDKNNFMEFVNFVKEVNSRTKLMINGRMS